MAVQYSQFYDQFVALVDSISHESDERQRVRNLYALQRDAHRILVLARDEAAYAMRCRYSSEDAAALSGIDRKRLDYWAYRHRDRAGLPGLKRQQRVDISEFIDLSDMSPYRSR